MAKESLQSVENLEAVDDLSEKKQHNSLELLIIVKILQIRLRNSQDYHQNISKKMQNYPPKKGFFSYAFSGRDITGKSVDDMLYEAQRKVILEIAEKEPCVMIGRNTDFYTGRIEMMC